MQSEKEKQVLRDKINSLERRLLQLEDDLWTERYLRSQCERSHKELSRMNKRDYDQLSININVFEETYPEELRSINSLVTFTHVPYLQSTLINKEDDNRHHLTPNHDNNSKLQANLFSLDAISRSLSTIEVQMRTRGQKRSTQSPALPKRNLFTLSNFYDTEVKVDDHDEHNSSSESITNCDKSIADFIDDTDLIDHGEPSVHNFQLNSPRIRIGKVDLDDIAKKYISSSENVIKRSKKRKRFFISSSSDSE